MATVGNTIVPTLSPLGAEADFGVSVRGGFSEPVKLNHEGLNSS